MIQLSQFIFILLITFTLIVKANAMTKDKLRIASFNVSMEALNYRGNSPKVPTGSELMTALESNHQQIKNIAEIIQTVNPDIILLNEFDNGIYGKKALSLFLSKYLQVGQQHQQPINFLYSYQGDVNTGVLTSVDLNSDGEITPPSDTHGFGYFPGHFGMALLSKHPIDTSKIRTFQLFKWKDMPKALKPFSPETNKAWYSDKAWDELRLSSKSHWDIPIQINNKTIHILASHPTPPVFDGPEDRNGKRNHDEIRFWVDYISENVGDYIYDDNKRYGGLSPKAPFVILGDLNASSTEGDAINQSITDLLTHAKVMDPLPESIGGQKHTTSNTVAKHHTAYWRMRADYVLPSKSGFKVIDSGIFWPENNTPNERLIKDRQASSDHRLVWVDVELTKKH